MGNNQVFWKIDPPIVKGIRDIVSFSLMAQFKMQISHYIYISGRQYGILNLTSTAVLDSNPTSAPWQLCDCGQVTERFMPYFPYLLKRDHNSTHFIRLLGESNM